MASIFYKNICDIGPKEIQELIELEYKEDQRIEYKSQMYGLTDRYKKEITFFSNAYGWY